MNRAVLALLLLVPAAFCQRSYPPTAKKPVTDIYQSVAVTDDYRWLEDFSNPTVKQWAAAQNLFARMFLDMLPQRDAISKELLAMDQRRGVIYNPIEQRGLIFADKIDPKHQHGMLVSLASLDSFASEHVVLDPDLLDPKHLTGIDFAVPSIDGRYMAVSLSKGGSESGDLHFYEVATGRMLPDVIERVNGGTAGGSVAWNAQGTGVYYTRYPHAGERPQQDLSFYQQIFFHKLGDPVSRDAYSLGKDFPKIAETVLQASRDGRYLSATVKIGDGGDMEHWILVPGHEWRQLARIADDVKQVVFGFHDDLYVLSKRTAQRGAVLHLSVNEALAKATTAIPESDVVVESLSASRAGLFVVDLAGGPSAARFLPFGSSQVFSIPLPPISAIGRAVPLDDGSFVFNLGDYLRPVSWLRFKPATRNVSSTALRTESPMPTDRFEAVREYAVSKDGTKIPLNILRPKGVVLDGNQPFVLSGYGGYGISNSPAMSTTVLALLQHGILFAYANLRGGGEYGERWHAEGKLTKKQNVFDDFEACARHLIERRYTRPEKLGIIGGSNGGLLMGAEFTQHPELFRAVVSQVGIYDMLRFELSSNGAFNITELGTVKEADQFRAMYAYSPYHHVRDGVKYPAILFTTGDNDPRVDPMNSRKMTARLQASGTTQPVLLRTSGNAGHGIGSSRDERTALSSDVVAFLIYELTATK